MAVFPLLLSPGLYSGRVSHPSPGVPFMVSVLFMATDSFSECREASQIVGEECRAYVNPNGDYPIPSPCESVCEITIEDYWDRTLFDFQAFDSFHRAIDGYSSSSSYDIDERNLVDYDERCKRCHEIFCICCNNCGSPFCKCSVLDGISDYHDALTNEEKLQYVGVTQFDDLPEFDSECYYPTSYVFSHHPDTVPQEIEIAEFEGNPNRKYKWSSDGWCTKIPNRVLKACRKRTSPYPTKTVHEYTVEAKAVDSLDRSCVFAVPGLEDYTNKSRCSPVKATNDELKFEQEFYCSAVQFLRVPLVVARDETRLRALYSSLCKGKFDITTLKEAFCNVNEVLYELCWFAKFEVVSSAVSNKYLYHFFRCGKQLTHLRSNKITENFRTSDAFMHWLNNYEIMLRIFCDRKSNRFTQRLAEYRKYMGKNSRFDYINTCRQVEGNDAFIRKNMKYSRVLPKSKLVQDHLDKQRDRDEAPYEGQMMSSVREKTIEKLSSFTSDVMWNAVGDFITKIPEKMTSTLGDVMQKGSEIVSSVTEFCVNVFSEFKTIVERVLSSVDTSTVLCGFALCASVFMFVFVLYYMRSMFQSAKSVYALCVVKVLNLVGCNLTKIESKQIEDIFVSADYEGQSLSALSPLVGLAIGTALSVTDKNSMQAANAAINFASRLPSVCTSFEDMCKDSLDYVYHWYTGKHWIKDKKSLDQFEEFINEYDRLMDIPNLDDMLLSDLVVGKQFDNLYKLAKLLQPLLRDMKVNPSLINSLNKAFATVLAKHQNLLEMSDYYMTRIETVCLWLYGNPGQGKTTVLEFIVAAVYEHCREKFPVLFTAPYSRGVMHHRNKSSDYWEGYKKQFACIWNEALEKSESTERARMLSEFLTACEDGVFPLDMAFDQKGKAFFNSYLAVVTSNLTDAELDGKCGMSAPSAVVRRRTLYLQVVRDADFVIPVCEHCSSKNCAHDVPLPNYNEAWQFILRYPDIESFHKAFELGTPPDLVSALQHFGPEDGIILRFNDVVRVLFDQICVRSLKRQDMTNTIRKTNFVDYCKKSTPYESAKDVGKPDVKPVKPVPPPKPIKLDRKEKVDRAKENSLKLKRENRILRGEAAQRATSLVIQRHEDLRKSRVVDESKVEENDSGVVVTGHMFAFVKQAISGLNPVEILEEVMYDGEEFVPLPCELGFPLDYDNSVGTKMLIEHKESYSRMLEKMISEADHTSIGIGVVARMVERFYTFAFDIDPKRRKRVIRLAKYLYILENNQFYDDPELKDFPSMKPHYLVKLEKFCFAKLLKIGVRKPGDFLTYVREHPEIDYTYFFDKKLEAFGFFVGIVFGRNNVDKMSVVNPVKTWRNTLQSFDFEKMRINITPDYHPQQITTQIHKCEEVKDNSVHWSLKAKVLKRKWDNWCDEVYSPFMRVHSWLVFGALASVLTVTVTTISTYYGVKFYTDNPNAPAHNAGSLLFKGLSSQEDFHSKLPLRPDTQSLTRGNGAPLRPREVSGHSVSRGHNTRMHPRDVSGHSVTRGHKVVLHPRIVDGQSGDGPYNGPWFVQHEPWYNYKKGNFTRSDDYKGMDTFCTTSSLPHSPNDEYSIRRAWRYFNADGQELQYTGLTEWARQGFIGPIGGQKKDGLYPFEVHHKTLCYVWFWGEHQVVAFEEKDSYGIRTWDEWCNDGGNNCHHVRHYADLWEKYDGDGGIPQDFLDALEHGEYPWLEDEFFGNSEEYFGQSSSDQQVTNLAQHIRTIEVKYSHGSYQAEGILSGRRFICVGHFFDENGLDFHSISLKNGSTDMVVAFAGHVVVKPLEGRRDLVSIDFPRNLSAFKSLVPKLYSNLDEMQRQMPLDGDFCRLERTITPDDCVLVTKTRRSHIRRGNRPIVEIRLGGVTKAHNHELYYLMAGGMGVPGNCGLPYAVSNSTGVVMCIGVHTGKTGDNSVFSPIFKSDFPEDKMSVEGQCAYVPEYMRINTPEKSTPVENHKFIYMGQAPKVKIIPKKTRLRASPAQGDYNTEPLYPLTTAPAVLDWEWRERESSTGEGNERYIVYPLKNALKKLGASPARPVYSWMNTLVYERRDVAFEGFFPEDMDFKNIRPWSIEEVLFGIPGLWDGLARDTAIGYDIECVIPAVKSRKELWDPETRFIHPLLRILVDKLDDAVKRGEQPKNVVAACLKDETRDLERVELGKTRLFCVGSLSHLIWSVKWMGGLVSEMKRCRLSSDVAIGTNVHAFDWKMIYAKIAQLDGLFDLACGDFGNFDSSQYAMFGEWLGEACAPMFRFPKGSFEDRCIRAVCCSAVAPLLVVIDKVYWMDYDNASGNWLTGFLNSFVNILMFNFILHQIQYENREVDPDFYQAQRRMILVLIVYGDDNVWGILKKYSKYFNMKIFAKWVYELFGMTYTKATKGDIDSDFVLKDELSFLCRKFVPTGPFGGNVKAPLDEDSIYSMLMWIREPSKTAVPQVTFEEQFQINLETACQEWYHYGKERFEVETNKMKNFCRATGIEFPGHDYMVYQNRWLDHQQK